MDNFHLRGHASDAAFFDIAGKWANWLFYNQIYLFPVSTKFSYLFHILDRQDNKRVDMSINLLCFNFQHTE